MNLEGNSLSFSIMSVSISIKNRRRKMVKLFLLTRRKRRRETSVLGCLVDTRVSLMCKRPFILGSR